MDYGWSWFIVAHKALQQERNEEMKRLATAVRVGRFADEQNWKKFIGG